MRGFRKGFAGRGHRKRKTHAKLAHLKSFILPPLSSPPPLDFAISAISRTGLCFSYARHTSGRLARFPESSFALPLCEGGISGNRARSAGSSCGKRSRRHLHLRDYLIISRATFSTSSIAGDRLPANFGLSRKHRTPPRPPVVSRGRNGRMAAE